MFYLDGVPDVHEVEGFGVLLGDGADGEDSAVDAHVADLGFVGDSAEGAFGICLGIADHCSCLFRFAFARSLISSNRCSVRLVRQSTRD